MVEKLRLKAKETKSAQITFTLKKNTCPPVQLNKKQLTKTEEVKYLGIHLDRRLTWRKHISAKRKIWTSNYAIVQLAENRSYHW
jgi:hypothetical protein